MIGAVVGVQPFGGAGLSGTGPKAGGPWTVAHLTVPRLALEPEDATALKDGAQRAAVHPAPLAALHAWAREQALVPLARLCERYASRSPLRIRRELPGPTGETNVLHYRGRGVVLCLQDRAPTGTLLAQLAAVFATGNRALLVEGADARAATALLPAPLRGRLRWTSGWHAESFEAVLFSGAEGAAQQVRRALAQRAGARTPLLRAVDGAYVLERLVAEQVIAINTAAAGGNASLMSLPA
jgi:RHH-type proline utilization regulon transcriptional repressor/proline dehydrogenase/delta 1-pyrroline-5-carboxylate dehydrogenase